METESAKAAARVRELFDALHELYDQEALLMERWGTLARAIVRCPPRELDRLVEEVGEVDKLIAELRVRILTLGAELDEQLDLVCKQTEPGAGKQGEKEAPEDSHDPD